MDLDGAIDVSFVIKKSGKVFALKCTGANDGQEGISRQRVTSVNVTGPPIDDADQIIEKDPKRRHNMLFQRDIRDMSRDI